MGIEPTREALPDLKNRRFDAMAGPKCDGRVNFRGIWGHVGLRSDTSVVRNPGFEPIRRRSLAGQLSSAKVSNKLPLSGRSRLTVSQLGDICRSARRADL